MRAVCVFFFQAEDGIRDVAVTGVQTCALPISPVGEAAPPPVTPGAAGRLVQVTLRSEAPLKGGRALLVLKKAQALGPVHSVTPAPAAFEAEDFDGRFSFRLDAAAPLAEVERAVRAAGGVGHVSVGGGGGGGPPAGPGAAAVEEAVPPERRH